MSDSGQRTEKPTQQRLERARREGQFPSSKEFVSAVQFLVFLTLLVSSGGVWFLRVLSVTRQLLTRAFSTYLTADLTAQSLVSLVHEFFLPILTPLLFGGAALVLMVTFAQLATTNFGISPSKLAPDIKRLEFLLEDQKPAGTEFPPFSAGLGLASFDRAGGLLRSHGQPG